MTTTTVNEQDTAMTTVLIVDDQADIRLLVRALLRSANQGVDVASEASSGEEALAAIDACDPAVVLLDQMMPGMSGLETARRMLATRPDQRIILFSAYVTEELAREAHAMGVRACLPKEQVSSIAAAIRAVAVVA